MSGLLSACGGASIGTPGLSSSSSGSSGVTGSSTSSSGSSTSSSSGTTTGLPASLTITSAQGATPSITADGQSTVLLLATLTDINGNPISGTSLNFTTNAGSVSAVSATTGSNGQATVFLKSSTRSGQADVTVREPITGLSANMTVTFVPGPALTVSLQASPTSVLPGASVSVVATVSDVNGNPVAGDIVSFSVFTNVSGGSFSVSSATSNSSGTATATYVAGANNGSDTLEAQIAGGQQGTATITVSTSALAIGGVKLSIANPSVIADGSSTTALVASVSDPSGNPVPGATVIFTTQAGSFIVSGMASTSTSATTASNGTATVALTAPTTVGNTTVTATISNFSSTGTVNFVAGSPSSVTLSASATSVNPSGIVNVVASVKDKFGNVVPNEQVTFKTSSTTGSFSVVTATTNANGVATSTYTASTTVAAGSTVTDTLTAVTAAVSSSPLAISVSAASPVVSSINLTAGASSVTAGSSIAMRATITVSNSASPAGLTVSFSTTAGSFVTGTTNSTSTSILTDSNGNAQVAFSAPAGIGPVTITASGGSFNAETTIQVVAGAAANLAAATPSPATVAPGQTSTISVTATDSFKNPVANQSVQFAITNNQSGGSLAPVVATTNASGVATTSYTAGNTSGTDGITIQTSTSATTSGTLTANASVAVNASAVAAGTVSLALSSSTLAPNQQVASLLTATATDTFGRPLVGVSVNFSATEGAVQSPVTTNSSGVAVASYTASATAGPVTFTASVGTVSATASATVAAGAAATVVLTASPTTVAPGDATSLSAQVVDAEGNAVSGQAITFCATASGQGGFTSVGSSSITTNTSAGGIATTTFTPNATGTVNLLAIPGNVSSCTSTPASGAATLTVSGTAVPATSLSLVAQSATVPADNKTTTAVLATVVGSGGTPLQGVTVSFNVTGVAAQSGTAVTNSSGQAQFLLDASRITGTSTVQASYGGFNQSVTVQYVAGAPAALALQLSPAAAVPSGGSATIQAIVTDAQGNAVAGTGVLLSFQTNSSGATLASTNLTTNANGVAQTTYTAGSVVVSTTDAVTATLSANSGIASTPNPLSISVNAIMQGTLSLSTSSSSVAVSSLPSCVSNCAQNKVTIQATLLNSTGVAVANAPVSFSASAGSLSATSKTTDSNGHASVVLTAGTVVGNAIINANVGSGSAGFSATTTVQFTPGVASTVVVSASPASVAVGGTSNITATVEDANGNVVPSVPLTFTVAAAAGSSASGATLSNASVTTNANGAATLTYTSGVTGTAPIADQITAATSTSGVSGSATVSVSSSNAIVGALVLNLGASSVASGTTVNGVALDATVTDFNGNPVQNATVTFTTSAGSFSSTTTVTTITATTNSSGLASVSLTPPTAAGTVNLTAQIGGFSAMQTLTVVPGVANVTKSSITANPSTLPADGKSSSLVTVDLNDANGNPLPNGTSVTLTTGAGTITTSNPASLTNGIATFTLQAASSPSSGNVVSVQGIAGLSTTVGFISTTTGQPASIRFSVSNNPISVIGVGENDLATITITVLDSAGNAISESGYPTACSPINNLQVSFLAHPNGGEELVGTNASNKIVSTSSGANFIDVNTSNGIGVINLQAGTISGIVEVEAQVLSFTPSAGETCPSFSKPADIVATGSVPQISIASGPPASIQLTYPILDNVSDLGGGVYREIGSAVVTDRYGNNVADGTVVNLAMMDSVILQDNMGTTKASASTLTRPNLATDPSLMTETCSTAPPPEGGAASGCVDTGKVDFLNTITRNGSARGIQQNDLVLIKNAVQTDQKNTAAAAPTSGTSLTTTNSYTSALKSDAEFWIGSALIGGEIGSLNSAGTTLVPGTTSTTAGVAPFVVEYPANVGTILNGCYEYGSDGSYSTVDVRDQEPQSRQVLVVATSGQNSIGSGATSQNATAVDIGNFCFKAITPLTLTAAQSTFQLSESQSVVDDTTLRDAAGGPGSSGGDDIPLPFESVTCSQTAESIGTGSMFSVTVDAGSGAGSSSSGLTGVGGVIGLVFKRGAGAALTGDSITFTCVADGGSGSAPASTSVTITPNLP